MILPTRLDAGADGAVEEAAQLLETGRPTVLQFIASPYPDDVLGRIDRLCKEHGELLEVRFYGHHGAPERTFDGAVLDALPNVVNLATDSLRRATNLEAVGRLRALRRYNFGVAECETPELLTWLDPATITDLVLAENEKRDLDLGPLRKFEQLQSLHISGHTNGLDGIGRLPVLERLTLRMIPKTQGLGCVSTMPRLRALSILLGGREDVAEIASESIEELDIDRVRGFARFPSLSAFPALRSLKIEDQGRMTEAILPEEEHGLEKLVINQCKKLARVDGLANLRRLEHLRFHRTALDLDPLLEAGLPDSLRRFVFWFGKSPKNEEARERLDALGYVGSDEDEGA